MSKGLKKLRKVASKFDLGHKAAKQMGLPDPSGDLLYGKDKALTPAEQAQKQAKELGDQQFQQAQQQMMQQQMAAAQQAQQGAMQMQLQQDRDVALGEVQDATQVEEERPTIELATTDTTTPRKKFRSQIGGTGKAPSVRV